MSAAVRSVGTFVAAAQGTSPLVVTAPSYVAGDILVIFAESNRSVGTGTIITTPSGWTALNVYSGNQSGSGLTNLHTFYKVMADTSTASVSLAFVAQADHVDAVMIALSGVTDTGRLQDGTTQVSGTTATAAFKTLTTSAGGGLILYAASNEVDTDTAQGSTTLNNTTGLTSVTSLVNANTSTGNGGGLSIFSAIQTAAGTTPAATMTYATAVSKGTTTIAFPASVGGGDTTPPTITSSASHTTPENAAYSATATANEAVTWAKGGTDAALVTLNTSTGAWSVPAQDYETRTSVVFTLTATDTAGNVSSAQTVTLTITDVAEATPRSQGLALFF